MARLKMILARLSWLEAGKLRHNSIIRSASNRQTQVAQSQAAFGTVWQRFKEKGDDAHWEQQKLIAQSFQSTLRKLDQVGSFQLAQHLFPAQF